MTRALVGFGVFAAVACCLLLLHHASVDPAQTQTAADEQLDPPSAHHSPPTSVPTQSSDAGANEDVLAVLEQALSKPTDDAHLLEILTRVSELVNHSDPSEVRKALSARMQAGDTPSRLRALLALVLALAGQHEDEKILLALANREEGLVGMAALKALLVLRSGTIPPGSAVETLHEWWTGAFLDFEIGEGLNPGYLAREEEAGRIDADALPDSPWWTSIKLRPDDDAGATLLEGLAQAARSQPVQLCALQSLPVGPRRDAVIHTVATDSSRAHPIRACALEALSSDHGNWSLVASLARSETNARVIATIAVELRRLHSPETRDATVSLLGLLLQLPTVDRVAANRISGSLSRLDCTEALAVLREFVRSTGRADCREEALSAIVRCPRATPTLAERGSLLKDLVAERDFDLASGAACALIALFERSDARDLPARIMDAELLRRLEEMSAAPVVEEKRRRWIQEKLPGLRAVVR